MLSVITGVSSLDRVVYVESIILSLGPLHVRIKAFSNVKTAEQ